MADAKLSVEISAETKKLEEALKNTKDQLKGLEVSSKKLGGNLEKDTEKASKGFKEVGDSVKDFAGKVKNSSGGTKNFSGSIADLTEKIIDLKGGSSATGGAVKKMISSFAGFSPIGVAIAVVTGLLSVFGDKLLKTKNLSQEFTDSLSGISTTSIVEFKALTDVMLDTTSTQREQTKALGILKNKYSDFDSSILTTKGNLKDVRVAVDEYTKSLITQAKAKSGLSIIEKEFAKIIKLEQERSDLRKSFGIETFKTDKNGVLILKSEDEINEGISKLLQKRQDNYKNASDKTKAFRDANYNTTYKAGNERLEALKSANKDEISELRTNIEKISKLANIKATILSSGNNNNNDKEPDKKKVTSLFGESNPIPDISGIQDFNKLITFEQFKTLEILGEFNPMIAAAVEVLKSNFSFDGLEILPITQFDLQAEILKEKLKQFNAQVKQQIEGSIAGTFSRLGETIGSGMGNAAQVLGQGLGALLGMLADNLIQMGTAAVLASKLMATFGTITGLGAGLAAIAGGVALKASASGINGSASGGGSANGGADRYSPRSSNSSSVSSSGGGLQNVVFEIQGTKLVGVLSNTLARNRNLGGSLGIG